MYAWRGERFAKRQLLATVEPSDPRILLQGFRCADTLVLRCSGQANSARRRFFPQKTQGLAPRAFAQAFGP